MNYLRNFRHYPDGLPAVGLLFLRIFVGYALAQYGLGKIANPFHWGDGFIAGTPPVLQALAAFSEFFGGLGLIFGAFFPLACWGVMCTMFVATLHNLNAGEMLIDPKGGDSSESSALYFVIALALFLIGPGLLSLDYFLFGRKRAVATTP